MSFQWVFDRAETISITKRGVVASTVSRNFQVKTNLLGGQTWRFDVKVPDGIRWSELRGNIEAAENLDRHTVSTVYMNNTGYDYINGYQGTASTSMTLTYGGDANPRTLSVSGGSVSGGGYYFKKGDYVQLGSSGHVYSVVNDVPSGNTTVITNRPVLESAGSYTAIVGQNVSWNVICVQFPAWTIFGYDQVAWEGSFVFYEVT